MLCLGTWNQTQLLGPQRGRASAILQIIPNPTPPLFLKTPKKCFICKEEDAIKTFYAHLPNYLGATRSLAERVVNC